MSAWKKALARVEAGGTITREELREIIAKSGGRTADESARLFEACPEWVAMRAKQDAEYEALRTAYRAEEELMVADLRRAGAPVKESVYDLVNTAASYPNAIPVLLSHLGRPYSDQIKEGIVRALTVREARGVAGPAIVDALRNSQDNSKGCRWAMANALTILATGAERNAIKELIDAEAEEDVRQRLTRALKTASKP